MSAALFPGFAPAPRHDPLHDAAVAIEESGHPDADECIDALTAFAALMDRLRALASGASDAAIRRACATARSAVQDAANDFATDLKAEAEDYERDGWRRYCDEADRAYEARRAREDACGEVSPRAEAGR